MEIRRETVLFLRDVLLGSVHVVIGLCNSVHLYTNYANQLKQVFNFTQTNMQILGAITEMSFNTSFPAGWLLAKFGSRVTMTAAMLMTSLGYLLLWVTLTWCQKFQDHLWLFCIIFLSTGFGSGSGLTSVYHTLSASVSPSHRGKVLCFVCLAGGLLQTLLTVIHGKLFSDPATIHHPEPENSSGLTHHPVAENSTLNHISQYSGDFRDDSDVMVSLNSNDSALSVTMGTLNVTMDTPQLLNDNHDKLCSNLSGFFLLMTSLTVLFDLLVTLFLVYKPPKKSNISCPGDSKGSQVKCEEFHSEHESKELESFLNERMTDSDKYAEVDESHTRETSKTDKDIEQNLPRIEDKKTANVKDLHGFTLLKILDFHLIIWPGVLLGGIQVAYMYNLSAMIKSFGLDNFVTILLTINFLACALTRIPVFIFIDRVPNKSLFLLIGGISMSISVILCLSFGHNVVVLAISIILSAFTNSCSWTSTSALLPELFGTKYFGYNFGWMLSGYGVFALGIQTLAGYFYDMNIDLSVTHTCYGRQCFLVILIICLSLCVVSMICSSVHLWKGSRLKDKEDVKQ